MQNDFFCLLNILFCSSLITVHLLPHPKSKRQHHPEMVLFLVAEGEEDLGVSDFLFSVHMGYSLVYDLVLHVGTYTRPPPLPEKVCDWVSLLQLLLMIAPHHKCTGEAVNVKFKCHAVTEKLPGPYGLLVSVYKRYLPMVGVHKLRFQLSHILSIFPYRYKGSHNTTA